MSLLGQIFRQGLFDDPGTCLGLCRPSGGWKANPTTWVTPAANFALHSYGSRASDDYDDLSCPQ
jgi:hypothetical protein